VKENKQVKSARDTATKKHIATFHGFHHISERVGPDLHVFQLLDENNEPASVESTADAAGRPAVIRSLSDLNEAWSKRPNAHQRRA
jgi:hypothetical protein